MRKYPILLVLLLSVLGAYPAEAQRLQQRENAIEAERAIAQLRSPYCPGFMLEICPSAPAVALRDSLYDMAAEGWKADELVEWMLANHGEEWRGVPKRSGAGLWAWVMPPLALLVGLGVFVGWLRANRSDEEKLAGGSRDDLSDADRAKIASALREWEENGEEEDP
jgi:cytochrome c-type biogenesis protein CcmH/NrfF